MQGTSPPSPVSPPLRRRPSPRRSPRRRPTTRPTSRPPRRRPPRPRPRPRPAARPARPSSRSRPWPSPPPPAVDAYSLRLVATRKLYDLGIVHAALAVAGRLAPGTAVRLHPHDFDRVGVSAGRPGRRCRRPSGTRDARRPTPTAACPAGRRPSTSTSPAPAVTALIDSPRPVTDVRVDRRHEHPRRGSAARGRHRPGRRPDRAAEGASSPSPCCSCPCCSWCGSSASSTPT